MFFGVVGPGSMNDNRSYKKCGLDEVIDNLPQVYYILGDVAYSLSNNLLIPFVGSHMDDIAKDAYNCFLLQLRIHL